jgi:hypothetical protein
MGIDLILLPIESEDVMFSHTVLSCGRSRELFDEIMKLKSKDLWAALSTYVANNERGDPCYGKVEFDSYDAPLKYVAAKYLVSLASHEDVGSYPQNKAIWAYLAALPPETKIVLYWH